jgi:glyoxylase-like metal-dependent hydrolase (beta-lactamase superfamily II)
LICEKHPAPALFLAVLAISILAPSGYAAEYSIQAIRYADSIGDPVNSMVMGAPDGETMDSVYVIWLVQGEGRNVLFDSGFHRERWFEEWAIEDYIRPDDAVRLAGVEPEDVTDIVISHSHWDHMGGIDLFPNATVWIQEDEYRYYSGAAWQPGGENGGIDPDDVLELVKINTGGRLRLIDGDDQEILPGLRVFTGSRHTFQSQYLLVEGEPNFILASDNVYLFRNLEERAASLTFEESNHPANITAHDRMAELAGSMDRIVPGHDAMQFERFPTEGRIAIIKN